MDETTEEDSTSTTIRNVSSFLHITSSWKQGRTGRGGRRSTFIRVVNNNVTSGRRSRLKINFRTQCGRRIVRRRYCFAYAASMGCVVRRFVPTTFNDHTRYCPIADETLLPGGVQSTQHAALDAGQTLGGDTLAGFLLESPSVIDPFAKSLVPQAVKDRQDERNLEDRVEKLLQAGNFIVRPLQWSKGPGTVMRKIQTLCRRGRRGGLSSR